MQGVGGYTAAETQQELCTGTIQAGTDTKVKGKVWWLHACSPLQAK